MADVRITSIDQVQTGLFVKFVDRDQSGRFSHTGEVTKVFVDKKPPKKVPQGHAGHSRDVILDTESYFEMLTVEGTMGFDFGNPDNNELYITTTKPPGWSKFKKDPSKFNAEKAESETVQPVKTKREQVLELVLANPKKREDALLKLAVKQLGGSESQLRSYIKLALSKK